MSKTTRIKFKYTAAISLFHLFAFAAVSLPARCSCVAAVSISDGGNKEEIQLPAVNAIIYNTTPYIQQIPNVILRKDIANRLRNLIIQNRCPPPAASSFLDNRIRHFYQ
eukprot:4367067-Pleurochrysis_carterae.AAC.1